MKNRLTVLSFLLLTLTLFGWRNNPPDLRTGATSNSTCASASCHSGGTDIEGTLSLQGLDDVIESGQTYNLTVSLRARAGSPSIAGFQMVAVNADNMQQGSFSTNDSGIGISVTNDIQHIDHQAAKSFNSDRASFNFSWTAPMVTSDENVTMHLVSIMADGNGGRSGDLFLSLEEMRTIRSASMSVDVDNDGFDSDEDCDDTDPNINPNAEEIANNDIDEDCDGEVLVIDDDMDGYNSDEDCDDMNPNANPDADEIANNDIDEDCDGEVLVIDEDMDGFNSDEDCDDMNPNVNPDANEIMSDGIDNNCDGSIDECICTQEVIPVCGSNGETYTNACEAECAGITEYEDGPCDEMIKVSGTISSASGVGLANVTIRISDGRSITSNNDGQFEFDFEALDTSLNLVFSRNDNHANGLSALDLVQTINHILGQTPFGEDTQLLAADADGNGSVSAADLVQILNVLLGNWSEFPNRESWGFEPTSISVSDLSDGDSISITAYKVGDVNNSADPK